MTNLQSNPDKIIPRDLFFQIVGVLARSDGFIILKRIDGMKWAEKLMVESRDYVANQQSERDKALSDFVNWSQSSVIAVLLYEYKLAGSPEYEKLRTIKQDGERE